jgi:hypothetical protein
VPEVRKSLEGVEHAAVFENPRIRDQAFDTCRPGEVTRIRQENRGRIQLPSARGFRIRNPEHLVCLGPATGNLPPSSGGDPSPLPPRAAGDSGHPNGALALLQEQVVGDRRAARSFGMEDRRTEGDERVLANPVIRRHVDEIYSPRRSTAGSSFASGNSMFGRWRAHHPAFGRSRASAW